MLSCENKIEYVQLPANGDSKKIKHHGLLSIYLLRQPFSTHYASIRIVSLPILWLGVG
jgi:hypothetical protein